MDKCFFCQSQDQVKTCAKCGLVSICQDLRHQQIHGDCCYPFRVVHSGDDRGRFLVATRPIEPQEVVFTDHPFVVVPRAFSPTVCISCFRKILRDEDEPNRCPKCHMPLCQASSCRGPASAHSLEECQTLSAALERMAEPKRQSLLDSTKFSGNPCPINPIIGVLRMLLASKSEAKSEEWQRFISCLMDHEVSRKTDKKTWMLNHILVVGFIRGSCRIDEPDSEIHRMLGILRTNGVKLDTGKNGVGVFPIYSLLNHSCIPNVFTRKRSKDQGHAFDVVAIKPIAEGEQIFTRYTRPQWGTLRRQQLFQNQWYFACHCERCEDPTEFGSMLNAVKCQHCQLGYSLPTCPTDLKSDWKCQDCQVTSSCSETLELVAKAETEMMKIKETSSADLIDQTQALLRQWLHPHHFVMVNLLENLIKFQTKRISSASDLESKQKAQSERVRLFDQVMEVMTMVDGDGGHWSETRSRMISSFNKEVEELSHIIAKN